MSDKLTWEWHARAEKEMRKLPLAASAKLNEAIGRYLKGGARQREIESMTGHSKLWEVRVQAANGWPRVLFWKDGAHCTGLAVFMKKSNKTPADQIEKALKRRP